MNIKIGKYPFATFIISEMCVFFVYTAPPPGPAPGMYTSATAVSLFVARLYNFSFKVYALRPLSYMYFMLWTLYVCYFVLIVNSFVFVFNFIINDHGFFHGFAPSSAPRCFTCWTGSKELLAKRRQIGA